MAKPAEPITGAGTGTGESPPDLAAPDATRGPAVGVPDAPGSSPSAPPLVVTRTRTSAAYVGLAVGLVVLALVIVFVAQNLHDASVHFLNLNFRMPVGLLILASAVAGGVLVLLVSAARVVQLRLMARRHRAGKAQR